MTSFYSHWKQSFHFSHRSLQVCFTVDPVYRQQWGTEEQLNAGTLHCDEMSCWGGSLTEQLQKITHSQETTRPFSIAFFNGIFSEFHT